MKTRSPVRSTLLRRIPTAAALALFALSCASEPRTPAAPTADCFREVATRLSTDEMEGRGIGTVGLKRTAQFLADRYIDMGLDAMRIDSPAPSYRQTFSATIGVRAGDDNHLTWSQPLEPGEGAIDAETDGRDTNALVFRDEFMPFGFSSSASFRGEVVFVGYGIVADYSRKTGAGETAAEEAGEETGKETSNGEAFQYNDYQDVDLEGRIALAMRYEPRESDAQSPFDGKRPSRFSALRYKALKAREAGAKAIVFVSPPGDDEDRLPRTGRRGAVSNAGIPVIQVSRGVVEQWFEAAGEDLEALHGEIETTLEPHSRVLTGVSLDGTTDINAEQTSLENIVATLPGQGSLKDETVVIGAHFDHLGFGGPSSLDPDSDAVHNGADDNASGVAAMLCAVEDLQSRLHDDSRARRTLVVAAFNGEETGLLGSNYFVRHPPRPIEDTVAMVNLDMVGRLRHHRLHAFGTDSSPDWSNLLDSVARVRGFDLVAGGDGYGPSDQMAFYGAGVPVVHFFTGSHSEYHTPLDDSDRLNFLGGTRIARVVADTLTKLLLRDERLVYQSSGHGSTMAGDSRGYGAYLGTVPDYADMMSREGGVLLSTVRPGAPADVAGIRGGDRIIEIDETKIHNLHDMTFVLRDHRPGEIVEVVVARGDEIVRLRATLGRRGKQATPKAGDPHSVPEDEADPHTAPGGEPAFHSEAEPAPNPHAE